MNLERITVEFHAEEDRLLLRVFCDKTFEIQFWLTRRLVKRIWPVLLQMAQARPEIQLQPNPEARKALLGFQHEKALQEVKFSKTTQESGREHPLGKRADAGEQSAHATQSEKPDRPFADAAGGQRRGSRARRHVAARRAEAHAGHRIKAQWDLSLAVPALALAAEEETNRTVN